ncbi:MAG TPA: hypothetical protein VEK56_12165 [Vicinamibacterales bacterium]|nr:hypothetical protein [Vicinamibacterales bacterium]
MRTRHGLVALFVFVFAAAIAIAATDLPYAGKWKMNPAKSDFGELTITYEQLPSGEMQATVDGQPYKFKIDEQEYPALFGSTAAWKSLGPNSWQTTWRMKGKVLTTDTSTLSADGKTLTVNSKGTKPNGEAIDDTATFERVSGGPGLSGKWKTKNMKSSSPNVLELTPSGADGLTFKIADINLTCEAKLDAKDYPCSGPTLGPGWTVALAGDGPRAFGMTVKNSGKVMYKMAYSVSADGKTLTETGGSTATNEKIKVIYDRQ